MVWAIREFRIYLYGKKFTVVTDHAPLQWLRSFSDPDKKRLLRWRLFLEEYEFDVRHKPERLHKITDCLSRFNAKKEFDPESQERVDVVEIPDFVGCVAKADITADQELIPLLLEEEIKEYQTTDAFCQEIRKRLAEDEFHKDQYKEQDGILYYLQPNVENPLRVVIPKKLVPRVLHLFHDTPFMAHLGINKTVGRIAARCFWPGRTKDIQDYVKSCPVCQEDKPGAP